MKMPKKGPWTVAEDTILVEYIKRHGEGNWNMVERNSGLMRCGKSCRLRWFNHLRPNLKRGTFSPEEERIVVELHAQFGNRWARMAMQLPGRSDNEIKNFWNTRAKRLERAGLPLYPAGLNIAQNNPIRDQNHTNHLSSSNETFFSYPNEIISNPLLLQSYPNPQNPEFKLSPDLSMGPFSYSRPTNPTPILPNSNFTNYSSYPRNENGYNFRLGSISISSASTMHYPNSQTCSNSTYPFQSQSTNFDSNPNPMLNSYEPQCLFDELSLIQSLLEPPGACESSDELNLMDTSKCYDPQYSYTPPYSNDGLLEDICGISRKFVPNDKDLSGKGKDICMWDSDCGSSSPYHTTMGMQNCEPFEEMFPFDDDLPTLLESFPMEPEVPSNNWYQALCGNSPNKKNSELKYLSI